MLRSKDTQAEPVTGEIRRDEIAVPRRVTLEGFAEEVEQSEGVDLGGLEPLTVLSIDTENSHYEMFLLHPVDRRVVIHGGKVFAEPTETTIHGSSFGGSLLKLGWVGIGMRIEMYFDGKFILTSAVRSLEVRRDASLPGPF